MCSSSRYSPRSNGGDCAVPQRMVDEEPGDEDAVEEFGTLQQHLGVDSEEDEEEDADF